MTARRWAALWLVFAAVHATLIVENLAAPNGPLGDVLSVYPYWWSIGVTGNGWVGLTTSGVYPFLALVPIGIAAHGVVAWFTLVVGLDAVAIGLLGRVRPAAAVAWLGFQLALGPIALGRVDAVTVALAVLVVALVERSPRAAGILLAIATWVKVWPVVLGVAAVAARRAARFALWAVGSALALLGVGIAMGNGSSVLSFLGSQSSRGVQVESVAATPWLWDAWAGGHSSVTFNEPLITFEVIGAGTESTALLLSAAQSLFLVALALVVVSLRGTTTQHGRATRFATASLALVALLVTLNKVGSPQFVSWFAVPLVALVVAGSRNRWTFALIAGVAVLTHALYPYLYFDFLALDTVPLIVASARNVAEVVLLVVATAAVLRELGREKLGEQGSHVGGVDKEGVVPVGR